MQVENDLPASAFKYDNSIEFELYTEDCSSSEESSNPVTEYDMHGSSVWETIPDALGMYGMCSYKDWFEYLEFIDPSSSARANQGLCGSQSKQKGCLPMSSDSTVSR